MKAASLHQITLRNFPIKTIQPGQILPFSDVKQETLDGKIVLTLDEFSPKEVVFDRSLFQIVNPGEEPIKFSDSNQIQEIELNLFYCTRCNLYKDRNLASYPKSESPSVCKLCNTRSKSNKNSKPQNISSSFNPDESLTPKTRTMYQDSKIVRRTVYATTDTLTIFDAIASLDGSTTITFERAILEYYQNMRQDYPFLDSLIEAKKSMDKK
ncbi:hypothetical protein [Bacillus sp. AFS040349]|uniref:hypothetical protein n=1 Tax=Bacillus sp. AFS040349 TaxID=2033502 RepID=UPI000BFB69D2|nr:hypothetical protein [Bacillus sp. AFS040349]PGT80523.1 hypothetical protein COD11_21160 [Bacillus sp. AFS040349]